MKIRGVNHMPDFIQIRDGDFALTAYFRAEKPDRLSVPAWKNIPEDALKEFIDDLPYGRILKIPEDVDIMHK